VPFLYFASGYTICLRHFVQDELIRGPTLNSSSTRRRRVLPDSNLDVCFTNMYNFYFQRGFAVIVAKHVTSLMCVRWKIVCASAQHVVMRESASSRVQHFGFHTAVLHDPALVRPMD
jgi:hypothetical protein